MMTAVKEEPYSLRLTSRIVCQKCNKSDYIPRRAVNLKRPLCNECAKKTIKANSNKNDKDVQFCCTLCREKFDVKGEIAVKLTKKEERLCQNCMKGFYSWRGPRSLIRKSEKTNIIMNKSFNTALRVKVS